MKNHYVYRISNIKQNKHYYGVRSTKFCPEEDLGNKYFSSSTDKCFISDQKQNPQNYKYKIIRICETREAAVELEIKLHAKFNVGVNESFYNRSKQTVTGFDTCGTTTSRKGKTFSSQHKDNLSKALTGKTPTEETKKKLSNVLTGKKKSEETKNKMSESKMGHVVSEDTKQKIRESLTGNVLSEETKKKISEGQKRRTDDRSHSEETKKKISDKCKGKKLSEETKNKMSESHKNRESLTCTHCGKVGRGNVMYRYHFDNCRELNND